MSEIKQDWLRFFRNSIRPWDCWNSSKGLGVGLKFFGARIETDAVSTEAGLVISALELSSSWGTASTVLALAGCCFLREPDVRGRPEVFLVLAVGAGVTSTSSTAASILGDEVVVVVTLAFFVVVNSSAMTTSVNSPPSTGELVCSSTSVKSSSTKVAVVKVKHATAHTILTPHNPQERKKATITKTQLRLAKSDKLQMRCCSSIEIKQ